MNRRGRVGELEARFARAGCRPKQLDEFVVNDFDNRLRRRQRLEHVCADRAFFHSRDERLCSGKGYIGLEQRNANLAQRLVDLAFADFTAPAQALENCA